MPTITDADLVSHFAAQYRAAVEDGRAGDLADVCRERPDLIPQVEGLLRLDGLQRDAGWSASADDAPTADPRPVRDISTLDGEAATFADAADSPDGFALLAELGRGGMGVVYRARDTELDREVAVKVLGPKVRLDSSAATRFLDEVRITGQLQHPGIPPVYRAGRLPDGRPYMAMKLIKGRTLADLLASGAEVNRLDVFDGICQAVGYAHARGVLHRDLKPHNVMVGSFGDVQVMDWGLAKVLAHTPETAVPNRRDETTDAPTAIRSLRDTDTEFGSILGTPAFMSPEQAIGAVAKIDQRSDVFGLGAILCHLLTGKPPFVGGDAETTRQLAALGKLNDAFARLGASGADPELVALCKRCLSADPDGRPPDAEAVAVAVTDLRHAADDRARQAELEKARTEVLAVEQRKRRRVRLALFAAVAALLFAGVLFAWWQDRQATGQRLADEARSRDERDQADARDRADRAWAEERDRTERERWARNADATAALLDQCEAALRANDAPQAGVALLAAERRAADGGAEALAGRLARCRADRALLVALDRTDDMHWTVKDGKSLPPEIITTAIRAAFDTYGVALDIDPAAAVAARLGASLVRDRAVSALDYLHLYTPSPRLVELLAACDPDPFRDSIRSTWDARKSIVPLLLAAGPDMAKQPVHFATVLGRVRGVPVTERRKILLQALDRRPGDFALLMSLGGHVDRTKANSAQEQAAWYRAAVAVRPESPIAHCLLGRVIGFQGLHEEAMPHFREAVRLDPQFAAAHNEIRHAALHLPDWPTAREAAREAVQLDSDIPEFHTYYGDLLLWSGGRAEAVRAFRRAVEVHGNLGADRKNLAQSECSLGTALLLAGDPTHAAALDRAYRSDPKVASATISNHAYYLEKHGDLDAAVVCAREVVRRNPTDLKAVRALGYYLQENGSPDEAIDAYAGLLRANPTHPTLTADVARYTRERNLLARLPEVLAGCAKPRSVADACDLAEACGKSYLRRYIASTQMFVAAFTDEPESENMRTLYLAARSAGFAARGQDAFHAPGPAQAEKLRDRVHGWLRTLVARSKRFAESDNAETRGSGLGNLKLFLDEPAFAGLRPGPHRIGMTADERKKWDALWWEINVAYQEGRTKSSSTMDDSE